jgi:hypothetical protein
VSNLQNVQDRGKGKKIILSDCVVMTVQSICLHKTTVGLLELRINYDGDDDDNNNNLLKSTIVPCIAHYTPASMKF